MHETAEAAAQKLAEAAAAAAAAAAAGAGDGLGTAEDGEEGEGLLGEAAGGNGDEWCFSTRAMVAVVVIILCLVAAKVCSHFRALLGPSLFVCVPVCVLRQACVCSDGWTLAAVASAAADPSRVGFVITTRLSAV